MAKIVDEPQKMTPASETEIFSGWKIFLTKNCDFKKMFLGLEYKNFGAKIALFRL